MGVYLWTIVFIAFYGFVTYWFPIKIDSKKLFIIITSVHLIVIQGFRHISVGADLIRYEAEYVLSTIIPIDIYFQGRFEVGYQVLNFLFASLGMPFQGFIFLVSLFALTILGIFLYKFSVSPWFSYILYMVFGLFDFGFSGLRQMLAMSIVLLSFNSIITKKLKNFILIILLATLFHRTAIIFILIYPLTNWERINKLYKNLYLPILIFLILFGNIISEVAAMLFNVEYLSVINVEGDFSTTAIIVLIVFTMGVFSKRYFKDLKKSTYFNTLLIIVSFALLLQVLSTYSYYFTRINFYMFHFIIILIPFLYKKWRNLLMQSNKYGVFLSNMIVSISFLVLSLLYYQLLLSNNPHSIIPYVPFWQI